MRSLLLVPASDTSRIEQALNSGADAVVLDLEDSVPFEEKARARENVRALLREMEPKQPGSIAARGRNPELIVRVNALDEAEFNADMVALLDNPPEALMLPKVCSIDCLDRLMRHVGPIPVIAIAGETPLGVLTMPSLAEQVPETLIGLTWGLGDLAAQLGAATSRDENDLLTDPFRLARTLCLLTARAANVEPIDTVYLRYNDTEGLRRDCTAAFRDGFTGKLAVHPDQVPVINEAFTPTEEQIAKARNIIAAFEAKPKSGLVSVNGRLYDRPHLVRARRLLRRAARYGVLETEEVGRFS